MQRARRLASVVAVTLVGLVALAGCRSDPQVAAYVGDTRYTEARVTEIIDELLAAIPAEQRATLDPTAFRDQVVQLMVIGEAISQYARAKNIALPEVDAAAFGQQVGLPPNLEFTRVAAAYENSLGVLKKQAKPIAPSEAEQREAYDHATVQGGPVDEPFEAVKEVFNAETMGPVLGVRLLLTEALEAANVAMNPRYDTTHRLSFQVVEGAQTWLGVELTGPKAVRDAPTATPAVTAP